LQVLVTGSTLGIGKALAARFVKLGAHVIINGRSEANVTKAIQGARPNLLSVLRNSS